MSIPGAERVFVADRQGFAFSCKDGALNIKRKREVGMGTVRKVALFVGLVLGAGAGALASLTDGFGLKIVMILLGALVGAAIAGGLSRIGTRQRANAGDLSSDVAFSSNEQMRSYWRDKGNIYPMPGHPDPEGARRDSDART